MDVQDMDAHAGIDEESDLNGNDLESLETSETLEIIENAATTKPEMMESSSGVVDVSTAFARDDLDERAFADELWMAEETPASAQSAGGADVVDNTDAFFETWDSSADEPAFTLPKSSRQFPFAAAKRPERNQLRLGVLIKEILSNKKTWVGIGPILVLGFLLFSMLFVQSQQPMMMMVDGSPLALVTNQEAGQELLDQASLELSSGYPAAANFRQAAVISYTKSGVPLKAKPTNKQQAVDALKTSITWLVDGWAISVDNERTVFLPSKADAEAVLESIKKMYLPEGNAVELLSVEFVQPVELVTQEIPITNLGNSDQALKMLTEGKEPLREHKVQSGESFWSIANKYGMSVETLKEINGISGNLLPVGKVLRLNSPQPLLSVRTLVSALSAEEIPYNTVYRSNENAWQGQSKVLAAGEAGAKEVTYQMAQINGVLMEKIVLSETVVADPIDRVVENGTKTIVASRGSSGKDNGEAAGGLAWPIRGRVNSPFGPRSRGFHSGIDIQASTGDPVYSAEGGIVKQASYSGGYGNCVTIDHGEGLSTVYAHLHQLNVVVGQEVGREELIGLAGTSGRTTGPHLHFEVRINDDPTDPLGYLK